MNLKTKELNLIYEDKENTILYFISSILGDIQKIIVLYDAEKTDDTLFDKTLITYQKQIPKDIIFDKNTVFILFDDYLNLLQLQENIMYLGDFQHDHFFSNYPYFFLFYGKFVKVYRQNLFYPFFNCNDFSLNNKTIQQTFKINFVPDDYQSINYDSLSKKKQIINLLDKQKQFFLQIPIVFSSVYPIFQIKNDQVTCDIQEFHKIEDCLFGQLEIIWKKKLFFSGKLSVIFQTKMSQLFIQDCESQNRQSLGFYEIISEENVYVFQYFVLLVNQDGKKIKVCNFKLYPKIIINQLDLRDKIEGVQFFKKNAYLIYSSCDIVQLELFSFALFERAKFHSTTFQCNNSTVFLMNNLLNYKSRQLILVTNNFIKKLSFKYIQIKSILVSDQFYTQFIMHIYKNSKHYFVKYSIYEDEIIKNFELPTYMFTYTTPIRYDYNEKYLVVAAFRDEQKKDKTVLLVYDMNNEKHNILVDILDNVDDKDFQLCNENRLIFYRGKELYYKQFQTISFSCSIINPSCQFNKNIKLLVIMSSKLFQYQQQTGEIILFLRNINTSLVDRNGSKIILNNQIEQFYLDPRQFVLGPVSYITSQDYYIQQPLKLIIQKKMLQCSLIIKHLCIDETNNKIQDIFSNKFIIQNQIQEQIDSIEVENNYIIIQKMIAHQKFIQFYTMQLQIVFEQEINSFYQNLRFEIFNQYFFLFTLQNIVVYQINNSLSPIQKISKNCQICQMVQLNSYENIFLIYGNQMSQDPILQLIIREGIIDITQFRSQLLIEEIQIEKDFQIFITSYHKKYFNEDTYYFAAKGLIYDYKYNCYIFQAKVDYEQQLFKIDKVISVVRLYNLSTFFQFYFFSENLFIVQNTIGELNLYNISDYQEFQLIDPIYQMFIQDQNLQILNNSHFVLISQNYQNISLHKIQPYQLSPNSKKVISSIQLFNQVSQIELKIEFESYQNYNSILKGTAVILGMIIMSAFLFFLIKQKKKYNNNRCRIKTEFKEIEI